MPRPIVLVLFAALAVASPRVAIAQDVKKDSAELLFQEGQKLLAAKNYAEACSKFEESQRLDPAIGTLLNLARCYELGGKTASAWRTYVEAHKLANARKDKRATGARDRAVALESKVPRLVVSMPTPPARVTIRVDEAPFDLALLGVKVPTDPGPHRVEAFAEGFEQFTTVITLENGDTAKVDIVLREEQRVRDRQPDPDPDPDPHPDPIAARKRPAPDPNLEPGPTREAPLGPLDQGGGAPPGRGRRLLGLSLGGAGLVAMVGGVVLAQQARGDYDAAFEDGGGEAPPRCDLETRGCDEIGQQLTTDARARANLAGLVGGVGVVAVAAGVLLYLTAPSGDSSRTAYLMPTVGGDSVGIAFGGAL